MTLKIESLGHVVGRNVRRLRAEKDMSLEDVALIARGYGFGWSASRVNALQRGARDPKLSTLLMLANVFEVEVAELLATETDGWLSMDDIYLQNWQLAGLMSGKTPEALALNPPGRAEWVADRGWASEEQMTEAIGLSTDILHPLSTRCGLTDTRTAKALHIDLDVLNAITWELFDGKTFGEARDRIAVEQHRSPGDVTTELRAQIAAHIDGWSDERRNPTHYPPDPPA